MDLNRQSLNYVYKISPSSAETPLSLNELPDRLPVSDIDQASGFVHLSTSAQILNTLKWFFKDQASVYILQIDYRKLESQIRWEDPKAEVCGPRGGEGMFPHLYNGLKLGKDEIKRVEILRKIDGEWDRAIRAAAQSWLEE
uniref:DUF952 domain-containing protein n=1 Tax=Hypholoma sublateritium (strain FD-334 SS-4) TaxID=945553 RepID=A0A0D2LG99_HYPSF|nr:hypothetical protein HYPSUDRAFT_36352 [Hypholoma sublateritium FD-334 SS-4]